MRLLRLLPLCVLLAACAAQAPLQTAPREAAGTTAATSADARFAELSQRWLDDWFALNPVAATQTGDHHHDAELDDLSPTGRQRAYDFAHRILAEVERIEPAQLSPANRIDREILLNQLRSDIWNEESLQAAEWDPLLYSRLAGDALYSLMARDFAPLPQRLAAATARMEALPRLYRQMRGNLDPARVPKIHAETASKQNKGVINLIDELIVPNAKNLPADERRKLDAAVAALRREVDENQRWIDHELIPNARGDFRLGKERYDAKLAFALNSPLSREEIRRRAEAAMTSTRAEMYAIARQVLAGKRNAPPLPEHPTPAQQQKAIQTALELAYADRPARDRVIATAEAALARATAFVREKDIVGVPDAPLKIIPMPEFQQGVALAYCDSPGPLDNTLETFYAVSPIPRDWTKKQVDSFLREYNNRSIEELTIHEAMPGHYLQLWHSNQYPSVLRAVLSSGAFIEGWAVFAEKLMADQGYLDRDPLYRLVHLKWDLRTIANALLDQGIHVDGMTREQAMRLMTQQAFQEEREAAGKWVRAQLTSAQLPTYFVGWQEHMDLYAEARKREGDAFSLRRYSDKALSFGSPPVRHVRELMFDGSAH